MRCSNVSPGMPAPSWSAPRSRRVWLGSAAIEPEHLLLSALAPRASARPAPLGGVSADALERPSTATRPDGLDAGGARLLGIDLDAGPRQGRRAVRAGRPGRPGRARRGHVPFRPSKKVLELALREAIHIGDNEIRTDHVLLGLTRPRTAGAEAVRRSGADPERLRQAVMARHDAA